MKEYPPVWQEKQAKWEWHVGHLLPMPPQAIDWNGMEKLSQAFPEQGLCLGNTEKGLQSIFIPALRWTYVSVDVCWPKQRGFTELHRASTRTSLLGARITPGWNAGQLKITAHDSRDRRDAPHPSPYPRSHRHTQSCGYRRNHSSSLIWSPKNLVLRLFDLVVKYLWKMISWTVLQSVPAIHILKILFRNHRENQNGLNFYKWKELTKILSS